MDDVIVEARVPVLVYQQQYDRTVDPSAVAAMVSAAKLRGAQVSLITDDDVNRLSDLVHTKTIHWLKSIIHGRQPLPTK